jgi:putative FmdB family regulatory protein
MRWEHEAMPIYEYECDACEETFEAIQKFSDAPLTVCRLCQAEGGVRKRVTAPAFRLKGGGWYETDFKKSGKRNLAGSEGGGDSNKGSGGEKKADGGKKAAASDS